MEGSREVLEGWALGLLGSARAEAADGYRTGDSLKIRRAAERAWKAASAATDAAMAAKGLPRDGTAIDRARHYAYLETLDRRDLARSYALFSDLLHNLCAELGHVPDESAMERHFDEVEAFIRELTGGA